MINNKMIKKYYKTKFKNITIDLPPVVKGDLTYRNKIRIKLFQNVTICFIYFVSLGYLVQSDISKSNNLLNTTTVNKTFNYIGKRFEAGIQIINNNYNNKE